MKCKKGLVTGVVLAVLVLSGCGRNHYEYFTGEKGDKGDTGDGCSASPVTPSPTYPAGGQVVTCGEDTFVVRNGTNGTNGSNGANGSNGSNGTNGTNGTNGVDAVLAIIDPCGNTAGIYDEVILKLSNGTLLASFSDNAAGYNTRFSVLPAGSYVTTDGSYCHFTVTATGAIQW